LLLFAYSQISKDSFSPSIRPKGASLEPSWSYSWVARATQN